MFPIYSYAPGIITTTAHLYFTIFRGLRNSNKSNYCSIESYTSKISKKPNIIQNQKNHFDKSNLPLYELLVKLNKE